MSKRVLLMLGTAVLAYAGYRMSLSFVDDEVRIRWLLDDAVAGFNDADRSDCLASVAEDFAHHRPRLNRDDLGRLLAAVFLRGRPGMGEFRFRAEVVADSVQITVDDSKAQLQFTINMQERRSGTFVPAWEVLISGELVKDDGDWWLRRTEHRTQSGRLPLR